MTVCPHMYKDACIYIRVCVCCCCGLVDQVLGGFLIAWLNTAPETIFFLTALETGKPDVAVGAMSGSVIVVCTVAFGLCVLLGSLARPRGTIHIFLGVRKQAIILAATLPVTLLLSFVGFNYAMGCVPVFPLGAARQPFVAAVCSLSLSLSLYIYVLLLICYEVASTSPVVYGVTNR